MHTHRLTHLYVLLLFTIIIIVGDYGSKTMDGPNIPFSPFCPFLFSLPILKSKVVRLQINNLKAYPQSLNKLAYDYFNYRSIKFLQLIR